MPFHTLSSKIQQVKNLASWLPKAQTLDTIDSPFLFEIMNEVVWKELKDSRIEAVEQRRQEFLSDETLIDIASEEANNIEQESKSRKVLEICKSHVASPEKCCLLYNLISYLKPQSILELGTSLGIATLYISAAAPESQLTTLEGDLAIMGMAAHHTLDWASQVEYLSGTYEQSLNHLLTQHRKYDLICIDGSLSTRNQLELSPYFNSLGDENVIWIIDDIYNSRDITQWWTKLKSDPRWNVAIDMYHFGILINNPKLKEAIDTKLLPKKIRWRSGLVRE